MASNTFRDRMNDLGWSRREQPVNTQQRSPLLGTLSRLNPFSNEDSVRLPTTEGDGPGAPLPARTRREEEEGWFALSRWDRLLVFGGLNVAALALFVICFTLFPVLAVVPRKFAILWTMASVFFLSSWAILMGPMIYARHLVSPERVPFTATYFGSIGLTLYFAVGLQSTLLTLLAAIVQIMALVWYLVSYFPMGSTGLRFAAQFGTSRVTAWMNG
ncbi:hypothetical protein B0A48_02712 [Cryoendolithus antarcticus]|uniref:Protein transport protein SFT2 n=1 Tax=Cryoendolithus antarcticus TaxID=1507870 RepID=A0A1V8TL16_9PEZI|nr:hypothetical protein B0A48_02712 [Cryoendolithus antarcticus]